MSVPFERPDFLSKGDSPVTGARKDHHLDLCLEADVEGRVRNGFDSVQLEHNALPGLSLREIDTTTTLLGCELKAPFVIGAMTGGSERAGEINRILAQAAESTGVGMALGSQRAALEDPTLLRSYGADSRPPLRIGNIGAVQLNYGVTVDQLRALVVQSDLDALALHLNPLQEAIQPGGDTDFRGLRDKIEELVAEVEVPVVLKEVGSGLNEELAQWAQWAGIACLETAGVGGTSWAAVEGFRGGDRTRRLGEVFRSFGLTTLQSVAACRRGAPETPLIASGGLRSGLDGAKAMAMGASAFAMARPLLEAAHKGRNHAERVESVIEVIDTLVEELRIAMFCTGSRNVEQLRTRLNPELQSKQSEKKR